MTSRAGSQLQIQWTLAKSTFPDCFRRNTGNFKAAMVADAGIENVVWGGSNGGRRKVEEVGGKSFASTDHLLNSRGPYLSPLNISPS
jgi:hypothetical protein